MPADFDKSPTLVHETLPWRVHIGQSVWDQTWGITINIRPNIDTAPTHPVQPRAIGKLSVAFETKADRFALKTLYQSGSFKALFPRTAGRDIQLVSVNTAGGVTGGDRYTTDITVGSGGSVVSTTQAAERAYRAIEGAQGSITTNLTVQDGSTLAWLPQETILFDGCNVNRRLTVDLSETAEFLMVEPLVFGRAAMGERLTHAAFQDHIEIRRSGTPLYLDKMAMAGDIADQLTGPFTFGAAGAMVSLIYASSKAETVLDDIRAMLPATGGASLINDNLLALRLLSNDSFDLRQVLIPVLHRIRNQDLPKPWIL